MKNIYAKFSSYDIVKLLQAPGYTYFSLSVLFSQIAFNMLSVVLIFQIFHLTSSNFAVSILLFSILFPQIILSFLGGIIADVSDKKSILVYGNLLRALALIVLFLNPKSLILVYFIALVTSVITQFYVPAEAPLIPSLVKKDYLVPANSIFGISLFGSILIGYVLAGPLITILGRAGIYLLLSGFFLTATFFAVLLPKKGKGLLKGDYEFDVVKKSIIREFKDSYHVLRHTTDVGSAFFLLIFSQVIILILATLVPGYAKTILQIPAEELSIILFAPAALGMITSAVLVGSVFNKVRKGKLMTYGVFLSGIVLVLFPFTSKFAARDFIHLINTFLPQFLKLNVFNLVLLLAFTAGFANALVFVPSQAIIQEVIPENFRSKIYGLLFAFIGVFSLIPIIVAGGVADIFGVGTVLVTIGIFIIVMGILKKKSFNSLILYLIFRRK